MEDIQFIKYIEKNYINSINDNKPTNINIDGIIIDINIILKQSSELAYGYGVGNNKDNLNYIKTLSADDKLNNYLTLIQNNLLKIINNITSLNSIKYIIIINNGILPIAMLNYKRKQTYINWKKNMDIKKFDINLLNLGTKLIDTIESYIQNWITEYIKDKSNLIVYYSPSTQPGNFNEKLLKLINDKVLINRNDVIMIYNNNIETILTSLIINNESVYIMLDEHKILNISMLIKLIHDKFKNYKDDVIYDFILLTGLVNTKIYPNNPIFSDIYNGLYIVFNNYYKFKNTIVKQGHINIKAFYQYLKLIMNDETNILENIATTRNTSSYDEIYESIITEEFIIKSKVNRITKFSYNKFKELWNIKITDNNRINIDNICLNYLNGIGWYYNYINYGLEYIDDKYYYMYNNVPTISDLYNYINNNNFEIFPMSESLNDDKLNLIEYKYLILPIYLNNEFNKDIIVLDDTILGSYRPTNFNIHKFNDNNIIVNLPLINPYIIKLFTKKIIYIEKNKNMLYISPIYINKLENTIDISKILSSISTNRIKI